nr:MAG TPA: hypothetical protein [Caudoviricetes sp.]
MKKVSFSYLLFLYLVNQTNVLLIVPHARGGN